LHSHQEKPEAPYIRGDKRQPLLSARDKHEFCSAACQFLDRSKLGLHDLCGKCRACGQSAGHQGTCTVWFYHSIHMFVLHNKNPRYRTELSVPALGEVDDLNIVNASSLGTDNLYDAVTQKYLHRSARLRSLLPRRFHRDTGPEGRCDLLCQNKSEPRAATSAGPKLLVLFEYVWYLCSIQTWASVGDSDGTVRLSDLFEHNFNEAFMHSLGSIADQIDCTDGYNQ
jgi:hypothetical protein